MTTPPSRDLKVLVVDDEAASRTGIARALGLLGYACRTASDGQEAWEMHQAEHSDIILSDWRMPRMDGVELCRRVRSLGSVPYTYFIFLTAFDDKDHLLQGMEAGADDYHAKPVDLDELAARLGSAERVISLNRALAERNEDLQQTSRRSFDVARTDALTNVGNRLRMDEELRALWIRAKRYEQRHSLAFCDIDWFKKYNDRFGHLAGDAVLRRVADSLRRGLRESDAIYRYGGEEFLLVLPEQTAAQAAAAVNRLREGVAQLAIPAGIDGAVVTISAGVAEIDVAGDPGLDAWIARADAALYRAKSSGRNRVEVAGG